MEGRRSDQQAGDEGKQEAHGARLAYFVRKFTGSHAVGRAFMPLQKEPKMASRPEDPGVRRRPHPRSTASILGHPIHAMLVPFPIAFFIGAFVTDIVYARTAYLMWQYFSIWLITAGLIMGSLAALFGLIDYFGSHEVRARRPATPHMLLNILAMLLSLVNAFVHSRDGWTAVVPDGIILSGIVVLILAASAWLGASLTYKHGVGVAE